MAPEMIQLAMNKASHHAIPVSSRAFIFAGARGTQNRADTVTTPGYDFPKVHNIHVPFRLNNATVLPTLTVLEASKGGIQVGNRYSLPVKASYFFILAGKDFYPPDGKNI